MNAIDVWAQITTPRMSASPWLATLRRWTGAGNEPNLPSVDTTLRAMDEAGVAISLLSAWHGPTGSLISNDEVLESIRQAPDRLCGIATADITKPVEAVREIRRYVGDEGFVGVRIVPWLWDLPPNHARYYPIYAACVELGVPLCTQIGHTGPLLRSETGRLIPYLEEVLLDFPDLVVVGGHVGFPWIDELVSMTVKFPNFHVDTSAYAVHRLPRSFVDYMKGIGSNRVMFGTNWPMLSPAQCLAKLGHLGHLGLTTEQQDAFLSGNARRVFSL